MIHRLEHPLGGVVRPRIIEGLDGECALRGQIDEQVVDRDAFRAFRVDPPRDAIGGQRECRADEGRNKGPDEVIHRGCFRLCCLIIASSIQPDVSGARPPDPSL
ncbi:hypothetical protein [Microbacterium sp. SA39]|uniref:hypothetical protein n=1 Tax=Microbacterium sp. SA39 TaxID=1263625 RepID=UPI00126A6F2E|nr:hypothetical protein [Microbacterium sp. SA39]